MPDATSALDRDSRATGSPFSATIRIKVCGITREEDALAGHQAGADYLGLVFAPSPRRVGVERARRIASAAPAATWVGVFAGARAGKILGAAAAVPFRCVQLHGEDDLQALGELRAAGLEVWRAVGVAEPAEWSALEALLAELEGRVDGVLLDHRGHAGTGGTGIPFDWDGMPSPVRELLRGARFGVSGGLCAENVAHAIARLRPDLVDASSRLEDSPGRKDADRVRRFVHAAREAAARMRHRAGGE